MKLPDETTEPEARHGKWYQDACGAAFAFELLGERWSLLIVRELLLGPRRFTDLRLGLPGISAKVLTERLEGLKCSGLVLHRKLALAPVRLPIPVYELTEWGYATEPAMLELCRWAVRSPAHDPSLFLSPTALMLSMKALHDPAMAAKGDQCVGFAVGGSEFVFAVTDGRVAISRGDATRAPIVLAASVPYPLLAVFYGKAPLEMLEAQGALEVTGDRELAARFADLFVPKPKLG